MKKFLWILFLMVSSLAYAQKTTVYLEHSDKLDFDKDRWPDCQILSGNVLFRHDNALLYCDSAYFYDQSNQIIASGNIKMNQGDTLFVYGKHLYYDGNTRLARLRHNVRMQNRSTTLYTDSLNYDRKKNIGYYFQGGKIVDSTNVLRSINGMYFPNQNEAVFQKDVILTNPKFVLRSDTLRYNTETDIADILGPSTIQYDSTRVYSEYGWYNTQTDQAELLTNSHIRHLNGQFLSGDTIFYDHNLELAKGFTNVCLRDSAQEVMLTGNYGWYNDAHKEGLMVQRATFIQYEANSTDSLFLTADTLLYRSIGDSAQINGYYHVQSWHPDFQALCDSMSYTSQDSTLSMYGAPIVWNGNNQLTATTIRLMTANNALKEIALENNAFIFAREDSAAYNQVSGKTINGYIHDGYLHKAYVAGNALTVYFVTEDQPESPDSLTSEPVEPEYIGINKAESSELTLYFTKESSIRKIVMAPASNGVLYTPESLHKHKITRLPGFNDFEVLRPTDQENIYVVKNKQVLEAAQAATKTRKRRRVLN